MFSSCWSSCFACKSTVDTATREPLPENVELLSQSRVAFTPNAPLQQLLTPLDLFPMVFRQSIPWAVFFNYDIDFQRLVDALHTVSRKYLLLCGRLDTDEEGRYIIEVGSTEVRQYDFPVVDIKAEMKMAEAILLHGKITTNSANFPIEPDQMPFYLESVDLNAVWKGQDPFLKVKLTHFSDGCCLAISMSHLLADGMRLSELYKDISLAYCRKEVSMREIDRQYMMYEGFSQHFSPEDKEDCLVPKSMPTGNEPLFFKQYPKETCSLEILYLSKELIDDMKSRVAPFIPKGSFVSTADLMQALIWMLGCEFKARCGKIANSADLDIVGTESIYIAEVCLNGLGIVPSNYFGNALLDPGLLAGDDIQSKSLIEALASLASLTRQKQFELKEHPKQVFNCLMDRYAPFPSFPKYIRAAVSNTCKFATLDTDFGGGRPALYLCYPTLPVTGILYFVCPVFHGGAGLLLTMMVTSKQKERLKRSSVLKECAPGIRSLFADFGVSQLDSLMKPQ